MNDLITINFSEYSQPKFVEKKNQEWVSYGADNRYPAHLLSLLNQKCRQYQTCQGRSREKQWKQVRMQFAASTCHHLDPSSFVSLRKNGTPQRRLRVVHYQAEQRYPHRQIIDVRVGCSTHLTHDVPFFRATPGFGVRVPCDRFEKCQCHIHLRGESSLRNTRRNTFPLCSNFSL